MTLLQPSDVPSREGINNAITSEIGKAISTTDPASQFYDTGWFDVPLRTGYVSVGEVVRYRRIGRQVFMRGRVARENGTVFAANSQQAVGDVPAGFRPNPLIAFAIAGSDGTNSGGRFWIDVSGQINVQARATPTNISLACTFLNN